MIRKTTRSILSVLLAALLLVTSIPLTPAFAGDGAVSPQSESSESRELTGSGATYDPYQIATADDLLEFADKVNKQDQTSAWAELTADIDLSEICSEEEGDSWTPIGNEDHLYTGTFDGQNFKISGLYINSSTADDQGLFGYVGTGGTVKDLTVSGSVKGDDYVGGVVGYNDEGRVENCHNIGSVSGERYVGGVVGYNDEGRVKNCHNIGEVSGDRVGGVVGYNNGGTVENCYNTGTVTGTYDYVGGVVGYNYSGGSVTNCYNTGTVTGTDDYVGGVGGVVGYNHSGGSVTGCYFLQQGELQGIGDGSGTTGATAVTTLDELCKNFKSDPWTISDTLKRPVLKDNHEDDGSEDHPYEIFTATQLENFRDIVNGTNGQRQNKSAHAKLMNDIDLSSVCSAEKTSWTPIGNSIGNSYEGTFNGNGHTISGLYIGSSGVDYKGLFGYVGSSGKVQNLSVSGDINGGWYVGGVVGFNTSGTVTGCIFSGSGSVSGDRCVGGVVGRNDGTVKNCHNAGKVSGNRYVGGVVGENSGTVKNCYNTGTVTGTDDYVGGVVGWNSGNVTNCYNTGAVNSSGNYVGGVVGDNSGTVENCYNTGSVTVTVSDWYVDGVVGDNSGPVENCYNTGEVSGSLYVGGVVGYNNGGSVTGCYFLQQNGVPAQGIGEGSGDATAKDNTAFHSGEVAYLLQNGQKAAEGGVVPLVWGQSKLGETTSLPTLNPTDEQKVYQVTFDYGDSFTETDDQYDYHYANANDNVTLPTSTDQIPEYEGHTLTGWQNEDGQAVTEPITVTADITFTAQWTKDTANYTVTVTTSQAEGGTVNGGGTFAEGTQVTVTATANDGYTFVAWQEDGEKIEGAGASYTFTVNDNCTLTAIFEKEPDPTPIPTPTPDPKPSGPSTGDSTGWDDIRDELENAENGDEITIDMGDETKVPAEIFESLAGKDVEISFDLGDIQWSVNGADIPTDTDFTDLDLGVNLDTSGIPVNVINTITGEVGTVQITLAHDGEFGFTMTLTAPLGKENAGYWANLYHYDEDAEALNFEAAAKIDEDGSVTIPFSHASQYAIVIDTHSHAAVDVSDIFVDVAPNAWYKDAIQYAYDNGLMTGVSDTEFAPEATTTRAMIVSILARLEGVTTAQAAGFADVDDNDWYATAVNWAANVGVVNGYEDGTFKPNTAITREQLAAILMNYAAYKGEDVSNRASLATYTDQPSTWAQEAMQWAVAEGLISGVTNTELQPQGNATRAQVAAILQRFLDN